jgi:hypothetical protein
MSVLFLGYLKLNQVRFQVLKTTNMMMSSGMLHHIALQKLTAFSDVLIASIVRAMEAVRTFEMSVNFYYTACCNIPKESSSKLK